MAVSAITERYQEETLLQTPPPPRHLLHPRVFEKSTLSHPEVIHRNSVEVEYGTPKKFTSSRDDSSPNANIVGSDDNTAVSGLLRSIQRPLSNLGRMFSDESSSLQRLSLKGQPEPQPIQSQRLFPALFQTPQNGNETGRSDNEAISLDRESSSQESKLSAGDAAARQAEAEAAEAQRIQSAEHYDVVKLVHVKFE